MFTPTTRPRGDANLPARLGRTDETVDLLSRRITKNRRTPSAGGVRIGTTIVKGTYNQTTVGSTTTVYGQDWFIETATGSDSDDAPTITIDGTEPGRLHVAEAGFYTITWHQALAFASDAPLIAGFTMNYESAEVLARWDRELHADGYLFAVPGVRDVFQLVDIWMEADEEFYPQITWASVGHTAVDAGIVLRVTRIQ